MTSLPNATRLSVELQCDLLRDLSPTSDLNSTLTKIVDRVAEVLQANACSIYTLDADGNSATQRAGTGYQERFVNEARCRVVPSGQVPDTPADEQKLGLTGWILSTGKSFLAETPEELATHPHRLGIHDPRQLPEEELRLQTFLGVPLRGLRGEVIGLLKAERRASEDAPVAPFSVHDQIVLESIARVASKSLVYMEMARTGELDPAITAWARRYHLGSCGLRRRTGQFSELRGRCSGCGDAFGLMRHLSH